MRTFGEECVHMLEEMVSDIFPKKKKAKTTKEGRGFVSNNLIFWDAKTLFKRNSRLSKILKKVKTVERWVITLVKLREVEKKLEQKAFERKQA